jgi:TM2 domain-containing membrane protein YozV
MKEWYAKLPKEVHVFLEYILPSAILTALIDYLTGLKIDDIYIAGAINIILIFLRQIKPRYERLQGK